MIFALTLATLLSVLSAGAPAPIVEGFGEGTQFADITITQSLIIRVPARRSARAQAAAEAAAARRPLPPAYREKKGPTCLPAGVIAGAAVTAPDSVDVILKGGERIRARLEDDCPALDYYSGFYVQPGPDGKICANRDAIHTRSGGDCQIDRFRRLIPVR